MKPSARNEFALEAHKLATINPDIKLFTITVSKEKVQDHIRSDSNKIYNWMICLSLINEMAHYKDVIMFIDERTIKVKSGNSLHHYLDIKLTCEMNAPTALVTKPCNSASNKNIQFADMLAGLVQNHFEDLHGAYSDMRAPGLPEAVFVVSRSSPALFISN